MEKIHIISSRGLTKDKKVFKLVGNVSDLPEWDQYVMRVVLDYNSDEKFRGRYYIASDLVLGSIDLGTDKQVMHSFNTYRDIGGVTTGWYEVIVPGSSEWNVELCGERGSVLNNSDLTKEFKCTVEFKKI